MNILALVPARGGSKRVLGKNLRQLGDKPLIEWTINTALQIPDFCSVLVSTDDPKISEFAKSLGASVPWLRPYELATDTASSVDVAIHAIEWFEGMHGSIDGLFLLQPTSPFRKIETISRAISIFKEFEKSSVIGVSPFPKYRTFTMNALQEVLIPNIIFEGKDQLYAVNGSIYLIEPNELRTNKTFIGSFLKPIIIDSPIESLDIDTEWDLSIANIFSKYV